MYKGKIPFDAEGNMLVYVNESCIRLNPVKWHDNEVFSEDMKVVGYGRGRSSAYFKLESLDGSEFSMFMTDFADLLACATIDRGEIRGVNQWEYVKRGRNYGVKVHEHMAFHGRHTA